MAGPREPLGDPIKTCSTQIHHPRARLRLSSLTLRSTPHRGARSMSSAPAVAAPAVCPCIPSTSSMITNTHGRSRSSLRRMPAAAAMGPFHTSPLLHARAGTSVGLPRQPCHRRAHTCGPPSALLLPHLAASALPAASATLAATTSHSGALATTVAVPLTLATAIFSFTSALMVPVYGMMIFQPNFKLTRDLVSSPVLPLGLSLLYIFLLGQATSEGLFDRIVAIVSALKPPFFVPDMATVAQLFTSFAVTNLAWVHLLLLDFYQARAVLIDGIQSEVPTGHSVALCFLFGPLGLLSHFVTRALKAVMSGGKRPAASML